MSRRWLAVLLIGATLALGEVGSMAAPPLKDAVAKSAAPSLPPAADRKIDFVRDIRPIFQRSCYRCHGPENQKSGYRLDLRSVAMHNGDAYAPNILPGKADSPLLRFVAGMDDDVTMPPEGKRLTASEIGLIRAWIEQGAVWPDEAAGKVADKLDWWSLKPLAQPPVPVVGAAAATPPNPIDAFVEQTLREKNLPQAPEADRRTLVRRLYFDLIGLPPTPEEVAAFVADRDPAAYEHVVDRLLASPRYGERWARHWMDAAHFAETHGHDEDKIRENAWPYRDYLIASFNADKPYSRFIAEQVAGDTLYPDDPQATVALGFLAAGPWDESSLAGIKADTLDRQIAHYIDRDDMISNVMNNFVSATVQCARCHDHKFDPISQQDYYALQADFAGVDKDDRAYDTDPAVGRRRRELTRRKQLVDGDGAESVAWLLSAKVQSDVAAWERDQAHHASWTVLTPEHATSADGSTLTIQADGSVLSTGTRPDRDIYTITATAPLAEVTAIRLELLADDRFPHHGPGRQDNGNLHLSEFQIFAGDGHGKPLPIAAAVADFSEEGGWGIERTIDGSDTTSWGIYPQVGRTHTALFELKNKFSAADGSQLTIVLKQLHGGGHLIGRARLSVTDAAPPVGFDGLPGEIAAILKKAAVQRTDADRIALARFQQRGLLSHEFAALPKPSEVYAASDAEDDGRRSSPHGLRPVEVLHRGDITQPRGDAVPGALSCVAAIEPRFKLTHPDNDGERRAALAHWLSDPRNPLTWRSIVNRVWQYHFGRGLVETPNDFGRMGALPTHPALLDWLAVQFRDHGQSIKQLNRLIVTSKAYRQSSRIADIGAARTANAIATDADNRFLWRMNRQRLDAECVRDAVLAVSGRLDLRMGGPSDRQFELRPGVHVTPVVDYSKFDLESDSGRRRSVYRFLFRTLPDPFMESLDCPTGDEITPRRMSSVTVQQALALWNDAFIARHCEDLAARLEGMGSTNRDRVAAAAQLIFGRAVEPGELADLTAYADKHGLANLCRVLFNANEFLFVN